MVLYALQVDLLAKLFLVQSFLFLLRLLQDFGNFRYLGLHGSVGSGSVCDAQVADEPVVRLV